MMYATIKTFFSMGFEEIEAKPYFSPNVFFIHEKDIMSGGKFEKYADYTRDAFERVFSVMLSFR